MAINLYGLLPSIVRYYDAYSSGVVGLNTSETTLQKFVWAIEQEADVEDSQIDELSDLLNADTCRVQFLGLLSRFLGVNFFGSWPEGRRRLFIKALVKLYHKSGQKESWKAVLTLIGYDGAVPYELWKADIYEDFDYYRNSGNYYGTYHAARVDIDAKSGGQLNDVLTAKEKGLLDNFRPIHVLIRGNGSYIADVHDTTVDIATEDVSGGSGLEIEEDLSLASDTCTSGCETHCEVSCEAGSCEGTFEITVTCALNCELFCEVDCEAICEASGAELNIKVSVVASNSPAPCVLRTKYGSLYTEFSGRYNGDIVLMDPTTGDPIIITVIAGVLWHQGGTAKYNGTLQFMLWSTGDPVDLVIVDGRIQP